MVKAIDWKLSTHRTIEHIRGYIIRCQEQNHSQQVAYSTYHDALTQVCFNCKVIRTNMKDNPLPEEEPGFMVSQSQLKKPKPEDECKCYADTPQKCPLHSHKSEPEDEEIEELKNDNDLWARLDPESTVQLSFINKLNELVSAVNQLKKGK